MKGVRWNFHSRGEFWRKKQTPAAMAFFIRLIVRHDGHVSARFAAGIRHCSRLGLPHKARPMAAALPAEV
jgi:hypothetical protein